MRDGFYLFILFIISALAVWGASYLYARNPFILIFSLIVAHVFGFIGLVFLASYLRDNLKKKRGEK